MIVAVNLTTPPAMMLAAEQCENCAAVPAIPNCFVTDPQCAVFMHQPVFLRGTQPWSLPCFSEHFLVAVSKANWSDIAAARGSRQCQLITCQLDSRRSPVRLQWTQGGAGEVRCSSAQ